MNDEKKDISTDFNEELAKLVKKKSRKRAKNDIYERFISRVQSSEDDAQHNDVTASKSLASAQKLPAFEPLSAEELQLFEEQSSDKERSLELVDITTTNATFDFSNQKASTKNDVSNTDEHTNSNNIASSSLDALDTKLTDQDLYNNQEEKPSAVDTDQVVSLSSITSTNNALDIQNVPIEPYSEKTEKPKNTITSSKKPIIIGVILGSLLIATIVFILIFTGVLSAPTSDNAESNINSSADAEVATNSAPVVSAEQVATNDNIQSVSDPNTIVEPLVSASQQDDPNSKEQTAPVNSGAEKSTELTANESATSEAEAAITYEDFRQESQTTLYRETND